MLMVDDIQQFCLGNKLICAGADCCLCFAFHRVFYSEWNSAPQMLCGESVVKCGIALLLLCPKRIQVELASLIKKKKI